MGILESLLKAEQRIQARIDRAFGKGAAQTPLEVRRAILEQVEDHILHRSGQRVFPFNLVAVHLIAPEEDMRQLLAASFIEEDSLARDIGELLHEAGCELPASFATVVDVVEAEPGSSSRFRLEFLRTAADKPVPWRVQVKVTKGAAEQDVYTFERERIQIGRLREVLDREGQVMRRNDVVFLDQGDDINATVGRAHATIYYSPEKNEYRIADENSRYGTRIFRSGRPIEVPSGNPRGIRLVSGDEIYLGQAALQFEKFMSENP